ncbi:hypothetical protein TEQG_07501 [Trichophyton equinum CBS 127.97]|uniref:Uncharacterized protein n=1 Tax=Trichophyton equinum (strain ATCC MYA-4606 / CBS 127.97) TaxID=559882 RepID=F2Q2M6_TRIEC|nr:hypothetical protein TEQG_07501 [Trichophyton equinum CBS 127.97]
MANSIANIGDSEQERVSTALDTIATASTHTLLEQRGQISKVFRGIKRRLAEADDSPCALLLSGLSESRNAITTFLQKPEAELLERKWVSNDPRVTDIERPRGSTQYEKFLAFLGERSLALEQEQWEKRKFGSSRVENLVRNLDYTDDRNSHVQEFTQYKGFPKSVYKAILRGQRLLVNERLNPLYRGSGAIYAFKRRNFDNVPYTSLPALHNLLGHAYDDVCSLAESTSRRLDEWQASYEKIHEQSAQLSSSSAQGRQLLLTGGDGVDSNTSEESSSFRRLASSEATRPIQDGTSRRTGAKRRRPNDTRSKQGSVPDQHRFQQVQSRPENDVSESGRVIIAEAAQTGVRETVLPSLNTHALLGSNDITPQLCSTSALRIPGMISLSTESQESTDSNTYTSTTVSNTNQLHPTHQYISPLSTADGPSTQLTQQVEDSFNFNPSSHIAFDFDPSSHVSFDFNPSSHVSTIWNAQPPQHLQQEYSDFNISGYIPNPIPINNSSVHETDTTFNLFPTVESANQMQPCRPPPDSNPSSRI